MMTNTALQRDQGQTSTLEEARVIGGGADRWILQSGERSFTAQKAFSCLVSPEIGDKVLSVSLASDAANILAILERDEAQTTRLKFAGDVDFTSTESIRFTANGRLDALAGTGMHLDSDDLSVRSNEARLVFDRLSATGDEAVCGINRINLLAKIIDTVSETSKQVMNNSFRLVSGLESVDAGEVLQRVKKRFSVQSRQVSMLADEDARVNGKRVHLG